MLRIYEFGDHYRQVGSLEREFNRLNIPCDVKARSGPLSKYSDNSSTIKYYIPIFLYLRFFFDLLVNRRVLTHTAPEYHSSFEKIVFALLMLIFRSSRHSVIIRDLRSNKGAYLLKSSWKKYVENERLQKLFCEFSRGYIYPSLSVSKYCSEESSFKIKNIGIAGSYNAGRRDYSVLELVRKKFLFSGKYRLFIVGSNNGLVSEAAKTFGIQFIECDPKFITDSVYSKRLSSADALLLLNRFDDYMLKGTGIIGDAYEYGKPIFVADERFLEHSTPYMYSLSDFPNVDADKLRSWQINKQAYFERVLREIACNDN